VFSWRIAGVTVNASNDDKQAQLVQLRAIIGQVKNWLRRGLGMEQECGTSHGLQATLVISFDALHFF
jgi:hypothetical protein